MLVEAPLRSKDPFVFDKTQAWVAPNSDGHDGGGKPQELTFWEPRLIGLHGKARSGKDTVGQMLKERHKILLVSFAGPIKDGLRAMLGLQEEHISGSLKEVPLGWLPQSPRQLMQSLGTEWGRDCVSADLWLLRAQQSVKEAHRLGYHVVITDVRFENEADYIRQAGGEMWHIHRDAAHAVAGHISEAGVAYRKDLGDRLINNNGTLLALRATVLDLFEEEGL
jgi:hypothetical protein